MKQPRTAHEWAARLQSLVGSEIVVSVGLVAENAYTQLDTVDITPIGTLHIDRVTAEGDDLVLSGTPGRPPALRLAPLAAAPRAVPPSPVPEVRIPVSAAYIGLDPGGFFLAAWQEPEQPGRYRYAKGQLQQNGEVSPG